MKALPKLNQLRNLRAIIQYGNISAAAQVLHQTQSTLTRSIQELEKTLGVTLLDRGMNGTVLTKAGMMFEPRMNLILNELERAVDELRQIEQLSDGKIAFGCSHFPATSIVPDVIKNFKNAIIPLGLLLLKASFLNYSALYVWENLIFLLA